LGFDVVRRRTKTEPSGVSTGARVWLIRAGQDGRYEKLALDEGVCVIGWSELGAIPPDATRESLGRLIQDASGEQRSASLAAQAGQIYRFVHEVAIGDLVVLPLRTAAG